MLVVILTLAAIITPPDVFSQILVSIPLYGLFELSIWVAGMAMKKE
jgi:sec-independent protein translocase protein TatC